MQHLPNHDRLEERALAIGLQPLRMLRRAARIIGGHAREDDVLEGVSVVDRLRDAFERMATGAIEQELLLIVRARHAVQPFRIRERLGQIAHLGHLEIGLGFLALNENGLVRHTADTELGLEYPDFVFGLMLPLAFFLLINQKDRYYPAMISTTHPSLENHLWVGFVWDDRSNRAFD